MDVLAQVTAAFALLPIVGSGLAIVSAPAIAQSIVPANDTTQVTVSNDGVIDIMGGHSSTNNLLHSFDQFHLEQDQTANFHTSPTTHSVIGHIIGGTVSNIDGLLQITGSPADLYLVNPAGLIFGPNARLDLGGSFTATTATHIGTDDQWFEILSDPDYNTWITPPSHIGFSLPSTIINQGQLTVSNGHSIRLVAPHIHNTGTLSAPEGEVTLLATAPGQTLQLTPAGGLLSFEIPSEVHIADTLPALITGGELNHSNELIIGHTGEVTLVNRDLPISSPASSSLQNTGDISTQGLTGGEINLLGYDIQVADSTLNATGQNGGGTIRIGGGAPGQTGLPAQTHITETTALVADAMNGDGGQVIIWSEDTTRLDGAISAQSVTGNGGLIETSGQHQLTIGQQATVTTHTADGVTGLWHIESPELNVIETGTSEELATDINNSLRGGIDASAIVNALNDTHVTLQATNTVTIDAAINNTVDANSTASNNNLLINAPTLHLNERITLSDSEQLSGTANTIHVGPHGSIQNAADTIANAGTINLAATTYREGHIITLDRPLTLLGQGQNNTYISGDSDHNGTGDHPVVHITSSGNNINLTGLTIQDGASSLDSAGLKNDGTDVVISEIQFINNEIINGAGDGGALNNRGSLTISDAVFKNNQTSSDGGAIDIIEGSVTISDSHFINNQANNNGGAISVDLNGSLTIINTDFSQNLADHHGGAIFSEGNLEVEATHFDNNRASRHGGAIFLNADSDISDSSFVNNSAQRGGGIANQAELTLLTSIVADNQATGSEPQDGGGGLYNTLGGQITVESTLISNNLSAQGGGGVFNLADQGLTEIAIANSAIIGNQATTGGGIASASNRSDLSQLDIVNSTISGNQAATGGGIHTAGLATLTNVTIAENIASSSGGGLSEHHATMSAPASAPALINTLVASNRAPINPDVEGQFNDQGNNLIGIDQGSTSFSRSALVGTINNPIDPELTPLNNNISALPSHQLLSNSPAANAGNNSVATSRDQHGQPRIVGTSIDIGAVESNILPIDIPPSPTPAPTATERPIPLPSENSITPSNVALVRRDEQNVLSQAENPRPSLPPKQTPTSINSPRGRLRVFDENAFQYLEDTFSQDYEDYWQLPQTRPVTLSSVQQILHQAKGAYQAKSAVIYAVFVPKTTVDNIPTSGFVLPRTHANPSPDDQLLLLLVTDTGHPVQHLVNVSRAELTQQAKLFRLAVADPEDPISYKALARQMYGWLLDPLQSDLADHQIEHVMYALDQGLRTMPLAAMMQDNTFVIEQYGISLIPSMGLTQPQFDNIISQPRSLIAGAQRFQTLDDLPAVPIELDFIAKHLQTNHVLLNQAFTFENFRKTKISQEFGLLHLATHAEFNAGNLEQSFIQFWDSPLSFHQMKNLSWPELELLILSACNTAISSPEAELGFIGLAAAAGIETSMGSLWNVSDIGTLALMAEFYTQLPNTPLRSHALQKAQLSLIRGETHINNNMLSTSQGSTLLPNEWDLTTVSFSHPFYWSGFTMVGNPWH